MTGPSPKIEAGWRYEAAEASALALEELLGQYGIPIRANSPFEDSVLRVLHLVDQKRRQAVDPVNVDIRPLYRNLIGTHEFASLLLSAKDDPQFPALIPHLRLLNEGRILQNSQAPGTDQAANKLFELYMGAAAVHCGQRLALDDPTRSAGDNPDILTTVCGRRWGIACKVLHSTSPQSFIDNLTKGLEQIDRSEAEIGVVIFNVKNVIPHDDIWPLAPLDGILGNPATPAAWEDPRAPFQALIGHLQAIGVSLKQHIGTLDVSTLFVGHRSVPGFLLWGSSPSAAVIDGRSTPCSVRAMNFQNAGQVQPDDYHGLSLLNWAICAGSADRGPKPPCP